MKENSTIIELTMTCSKKGRKSTKNVVFMFQQTENHYTHGAPNFGYSGSLKLGQMCS